MNASRSVLLLCVFMLTLRAGRAETVQEITNPKSAHKGWVSDMANVLTDGTEKRINDTIDQLERKNGAEMAVVTIRDTDGSSPKQFATRLFNTWGIGKRGRDNGVLVLLVMEARRIEVETGTGLSSILPDDQVQGMLQERVIPHCKEGDYDGGVLAGVQALVQSLARTSSSALKQNQAAPAPPQKRITPATPIAPASPGSSASPPAPYAGGTALDAPGEATGGSSGGLMPLAAGMVLAPLGGWALYRRRLRYCPRCKQKMRRLSESEDDVGLASYQLFEEQLGSVDYRIWRCDSCQTITAERVVKWMSGYSECPKCSHVTLSSQTTILVHPTYTSTGESLTTRTCRFPSCNHSEQHREILPVEVPPPPPPTPTDNSSSSSVFSSSSNSGSSSSGGFGGGSSSGGGAGASW